MFCAQVHVVALPNHAPPRAQLRRRDSQDPMAGPSMGRLALNDMKTRPSHGDQPGPVNTGWGRPSCRAAAASLSPERLTRPHASIPRNPLLAGPLFLAGYIEQAGTGTLDMIARCRDAGLRSPEFRQDGASFIQTLRRPVPQDAGEVAPQVTPRVKLLQTKHLEELAAALAIVTPQVTPQVTHQVEKLLHAAATPQSREALQAHVGLADRKHFREVLLNPLLKAGWLEMMIPDVPQSRLQRYRLAPRGRAWLANQSEKT